MNQQFIEEENVWEVKTALKWNMFVPTPHKKGQDEVKHHVHMSGVCFHWFTCTSTMCTAGFHFHWSKGEEEHGLPATIRVSCLKTLLL